MNPEKNRKISYNTIIKRNWRGDKDETPFLDIVETIKYIKSLKKVEKIFSLKGDKICFLANYQTSNNTITGYFKSARHAFRPKLIDSKTAQERDSPKLITEGEIEKTHFLIKIGKQDIYLLTETNGHGVSTQQIVEYFDRFTKKYLNSIRKKKGFSVIFYKIAKDNFISEINQLKRVKVAKIYFDKKLLGTDCLNFANRRVSLQRDIELTAKAKKQENIKETAIDFFNTFQKDDKVSKVRIEGINNNNGNVVLDTEFIEKISSESLSLNPDTGEIITTEIYSVLLYLSEELE